MTDPKSFLTSIFNAAVAAADPEKTIRNHLPAKPKGRTIVVGGSHGVPCQMSPPALADE